MEVWEQDYVHVANTDFPILKVCDTEPSSSSDMDDSVSDLGESVSDLGESVSDLGQYT